VIDVVVQEVDKERGRIGLKLLAKHEGDTLVMPEALIEVAKEKAANRPEGERQERPPRDGDRGRRRSSGPRR
jgi:transcriptional accessory protein Tex/SPT6